MPEPVAVPEKKEWTLMFYFASDNPLAPGIVTQLKALKQAGFHQDANVVAQFDPQPEGTPTHIFDVNHVNKLKDKRDSADKGRQPVPRIGFIGEDPEDPRVTNLLEDKLWREDQLDSYDEPIRKRLSDSLKRRHKIDYRPPEPPKDRKRVPPPNANGNGNGTASAAVNALVAPAVNALRPAVNALRPAVDALPPAANALIAPAANALSALVGADAEQQKGRLVELNPKESLEAFLTFCRESYPAHHYMLFILGHGVVVGNDIFLYDENAEEQSLSLVQLGGVLGDFKKSLDEGDEFELVSFHSCSVGSLEVAYQLREAANFMLSSQGPAFVGSWPYRQILMRVFKNVDGMKTLRESANGRAQLRARVKKMVREIFTDCFDNSTDFLLAGYSFDLCLCNLKQAETVKEALAPLTEALRAGLSDPLLQNFILLAHWDAQSYFGESYTDLFDFCLCLGRRLAEFKRQLGGEAAERVIGRSYWTLTEIAAACELVTTALTEEVAGGDEKIVVRSAFAGPGHQYTHGLSVFFPWANPSSEGTIMEEYAAYAFKETGWLDFLKDYFRATERKPRKDEADASVAAAAEQAAYQEVEEDEEVRARRKDDELSEDLASLAFNGGGRVSSEERLDDPPMRKVNPRDPTGDECTCPTIKNYPRHTRARPERHRKSCRNVPLSRGTSLAP